MWTERRSVSTDTIAKDAPCQDTPDAGRYIAIFYDVTGVRKFLEKQKAFEKFWAHSPQRAALRPFSRCR